MAPHVLGEIVLLGVTVAAQLTVELLHARVDLTVPPHARHRAEHLTTHVTRVVPAHLVNDLRRLFVVFSISKQFIWR